MGRKSRCTIRPTWCAVPGPADDASRCATACWNAGLKFGSSGALSARMIASASGVSGGMGNLLERGNGARDDSMRLTEVFTWADFAAMPETFWTCARTQPQLEAYAAQNLEARGVPVFFPRIETRKTVQPLFASYVFCLVIDGHWLAIRTCYGVANVIRFGDLPARVPDREIDALRARADASGIIRLPPEPPRRVWARGDKVTILAGQFASFSAIHSGSQRIVASSWAV